MSKSSMEILHAEARALDPDRVALRLPFHVLVGEAVDVARFFERYYEEERAPKTKTLLRPGLSSIGHDRLPPSTADRLLALVDEVQAAQTDYQLAASAPEGDEDLARGRFVLSELTAALGDACEVEAALMQKVLEAHVRAQLDSLAEIRPGLG